MIKKFISLLLVAASSCYAGGSSQVSTSSQESTGIVTPDVATGVRRFYFWNHTTTGEMVVCFEDDRGMGGTCKKWTPITSVIPPGRKFVGFKLVGVGGSTYIHIYWK